LDQEKSGNPDLNRKCGVLKVDEID
jgi:hypothetical protein